MSNYIGMAVENLRNGLSATETQLMLMKAGISNPDAYKATRAASIRLAR
jgi:hypothetical protein